MMMVMINHLTQLKPLLRSINQCLIFSSTKFDFTRKEGFYSSHTCSRSNHNKSIIFLMLMPKKYAFSCASSNEKAVCTCNCISCKQTTSHQCGKTCESSERLNTCKRSCTDCMQTVFPQNAAARVS